MDQRRFRIPREGVNQQRSARQYVQRAWPEGTNHQIGRLFETGRVDADGIAITRPDAPLAAETIVDVELDEEGAEVFGLPDPEALQWGDDWVVVEKPVGIPGRLDDQDPTNPVRFMADVLGLDRDRVAPLWSMPTDAQGPWPIAKTDEVADRLRTSMYDGDLQTTWVAITTRPDQPQGRWSTDRGPIQYATTRTEGPLAELQLTPSWELEPGDVQRLYRLVADVMADAGFPALGDPIRGGYLVGGGLRLRLAAMFGADEFAHSWSAPRKWWPEEEVIRPRAAIPVEPTGAPMELGQLQISASCAQRLAEPGSPAVYHNEALGSVRQLAPGRPVELVGPDGPTGLFGLIDGAANIAAHLFSDDRIQATQLDDELEIRLDEAIGRRQRFFKEMGSTDAFRVVHGAADGLPGLVIDRWGSVWRLEFTSRCMLPHRDRLISQLNGCDPRAAVVEFRHRRAERQTDDIQATLVSPGSSVTSLGASYVVRESGLRLPVDLRRADPGLAIEYRHARCLLGEQADPGDQWLVPMARTGAVAAYLARAGAETTNLIADDRTRRRIHGALRTNGLAAHRAAVVEDNPVSWLDENDEEFDGIWLVLDGSRRPPGYQRLLQRLLAHLRPGGELIACRGDVDEWKDRIDEAIENAADDAGCELAGVAPVDPPEDFPAIDGFPEAAPFVGRRTVIR